MTANSIHLENHTLDPARAEVWVHVTPAHRTPTTELRGRLVGPRCLYASTVEVAYPLRPIPGPPAESETLRMRVVIPEPSLWDPECPFLYRVRLELWQDGQRVEEVAFDHGLRTFQLVRNGLRINHHSWPIRGIFAREVEPERRPGGPNLVVASSDAERCHAVADERGLLVLTEVDTPETLLQALVLTRHASCLGFVLPEAVLEYAVSWRAILRAVTRPPYLGVLLTRPPASLPEFLDFFLAAEELLPQLTALELPYLVLAAGHAGNGAPAPTPLSGTMGWLQKPPG